MEGISKQGNIECVQQGQDSPYFGVRMPATLEQVDQASGHARGISCLLLAPAAPCAGGTQYLAKVGDVCDLHDATFTCYGSVTIVEQ